MLRRISKMNKITEFAKKEFGELPGSFLVDNTGATKIDDSYLSKKGLEQKVGSKIEKIHYIEDENYACFVAKENLLYQHGLPLNFSTFVITGYELYGKTLFLKKGVVKHGNR